MKHDDVLDYYRWAWEATKYDKKTGPIPVVLLIDSTEEMVGSAKYFASVIGLKEKSLYGEIRIIKDRFGKHQPDDMMTEAEFMETYLPDML